MDNLESWRKGFIKSSHGKGKLGESIISKSQGKKILKRVTPKSKPKKVWAALEV